MHKLYVVCGGRNWCVNDVGGVWKSWVVCGSCRWRVEVVVGV